MEEKVLDPKWYVIHTFTGYEATVKDSIENIIENGNLQEYITDIQIPMEQTIEEKNGKKKIVQRKIFPCYVFVKMVYTNDIWFMITNTRGVTNFVGPGGRPLPLSDEEVRRNRLEKISASEINFEVGDTVLVTGGAIAGFEGRVVSINQSSEKAKVEVVMFERLTEVDVELTNIDKIVL
ncbi:MAG: transcription termination/antitermination protein NusG [Bacillota bacterium]